MARFGVVGLGRIGGGLSRQALSKGHEVVGFDVNEVALELQQAGLETAHSHADLCAKLTSGERIIFLYIHAGADIDKALAALAPHLTAGDIVVDGGNSYWRDSRRRAMQWGDAGWHFVDLGTSGGVTGAQTGACFMAGGPPEAYARLEPILKDLAVEGGLVYCGESGSGHYVKLVHNGIEFGMLQAIGEGIDLLENGEYELPIAGVVGCWRNGSVIRSWLVDLLHEALTDQDDRLATTPSFIEDTGEVNWLVEDALRFEVNTPVIAQSVFSLFASRDDRKTWARSVALMRLGFGGHGLGEQPEVAEGRQTSRPRDD